MLTCSKLTFNQANITRLGFFSPKNCGNFVLYKILESLSERGGGEGDPLSVLGESLIILGNFGTLILTIGASSWIEIYFMQNLI